MRSRGGRAQLHRSSSLSDAPQSAHLLLQLGQQAEPFVPLGAPPPGSLAVALHLQEQPRAHPTARARGGRSPTGTGAQAGGLQGLCRAPGAPGKRGRGCPPDAARLRAAASGGMQRVDCFGLLQSPARPGAGSARCWLLQSAGRPRGSGPAPSSGLVSLAWGRLRVAAAGAGAGAGAPQPVCGARCKVSSLLCVAPGSPKPALLRLREAVGL